MGGAFLTAITRSHRTARFDRLTIPIPFRVRLWALVHGGAGLFGSGLDGFDAVITARMDDFTASLGLQPAAEIGWAMIIPGLFFTV
jgi:hypothetical protein